MAMKVILDCGCETNVDGKTGQMLTPCRTHFGHHKVGLSNKDDYHYRVGFQVGDTGIWKYFSTLEASERYITLENLDYGTVVIQRKQPNKDRWMDL